MTKNIFKRGFTLIELLVVIAIIGILAAVVLASLNSARDKGEDAAIQSALNNARAQAELYYNDNGRSYQTVCTTVQNPASGPGGISTLKDNATQSGGGTTATDCEDDPGGWAMQKELNSDMDGNGTGDFYCVDYQGNATTTQNASTLTDDTIATLVCDGA